MSSLHKSTETSANNVPLHPCAQSLSFSDTHMTVSLKDGRVLIAPLASFPDVAKLSPEQRMSFELCGGGSVIFWDALDEPIGIRRLMVPDGERL